MTNLIHIAYAVIALTNATMQLEPATTDGNWITNCWGTNLLITAGDLIQHTAFVGPAVKLSWAPATNVFLEWSADLRDWYDVRVRFLGVTNWLVRPIEGRFYRLRWQ